MISSNPSPSSSAPSRVSTPNPSPTPNPQNARFTSQASTAEDLLKSQTVGLVHLSDFRKRRAEALEQKEREAHQNGTFGRFTPTSGDSKPLPPKKKRKPVVKGKLSFGVEGDEEGGDEIEETTLSENQTPQSRPSDSASSTTSILPSQPALSSSTSSKPRIGPNTTVSIAPKAMTKFALLREAQTREQLRKEFLAMQEAVKATEILIPFVFYDGTNIPAGSCKVKKGDYVWVFLDRSRKVGAERGIPGGGGERSGSRREWARVGVDDLMLVRGEVIIPHHYELYYFIVNKTLGPTNIPLFDYTSTLPIPSSSSSPPSPSSSPSPSDPKPQTLEGSDADPNFTKVVDRRWYERNKHIFPASVWEEFDPKRDYSKGKRSDGLGNAFFFS